MRMHAGQVDIGPDVVARLVASQFPHWRGLPVTPVESDGTVNALFRLGEEVVLRLPSSRASTRSTGPGWSASRTSPGGSPRSSLAVPEPLGVGEPGEGYPGPWTAYRWIPGETATARNLRAPTAFALELARFARAVHRPRPERPHVGRALARWPAGRAGRRRTACAARE